MSTAPADPCPDRAARTAALFATLSTTDDAPTRADAREALIHLHRPLVEHWARRYARGAEPLEDLEQAGTVGLINAVDRFEPDRGVDFAAFASPSVRGEILRHVRETAWAVRVPRGLQELVAALPGVTAELTQRHGRAPTTRELARATGSSAARVREARRSALALSPGTLSGQTETAALDEARWESGGTDGALAAVEARESVRPLLERLPAREKRLLLLRFYADLSQPRIAAELGISQGHVSRLLRETLARLRAEVDPPAPT